MNEPKVSVVVCTYNGEKYLREQLDSILAQTYPLHEIIIQDDHSTDATPAILDEYARRSPLVRVYHNPAGLGVNGNFFTAMRRATGDFIALSDQDDRWHADKIARQMATIGDCLLCSGHTRPFSDDGLFTHYDARRPNVRLPRLVFSGLQGHTMLFRRTLLTDIMPPESELYEVSFYDVALELAAGAFDSIAYVDGVLVDFRRHGDATTYNDTRHTLPGWRNAWYILRWSLTHYRTARPRACRLWQARLAFLRAIRSSHPLYEVTVRMLELELEEGVWAFLRLQALFIRNHRVLFQTEGGGPVKVLRAALYPVMQYYHYR